ncbi:6986_t:CDS:2 [Racocetra fulgida]|uniref:6986_t:CDS:1 n=1 Tax=Racocetra fulgida TaxID=60492 RepID=A0A9N8VFP5_9GLOM|nr:6986_t:CDS:2 [Racocetra fulgida]
MVESKLYAKLLLNESGLSAERGWLLKPCQPLSGKLVEFLYL